MYVARCLLRCDDGSQRDDVVFDPEAQEEAPLVPGMGKLDNALRWGFIKKVYGIMSTQLALTALVAAGSQTSSSYAFEPPPSSCSQELLQAVRACTSSY